MRRLLVPAIAAAALGLAGCSGGGEKDLGGQVTTGPSPAQSTEAKIKEIQDNPNIPADAKQKAIAALQQGGGGPKTP